MNISDLNTEIRKLVDADTNTYTNADILRRLNSAYEETVGKLIALDTNWMFGDTNYTSIPTGLSNLTGGTQEYQFNSGWLTVQSVKVKDGDGDWHLLDRVNLQDIEPIEEYKTTNGLPEEYAVREDFLLLFPTPAATDVTTTNGLEVVYQRTASIFTSAEVTTGTKEPGFASPYHILLAYKTALPYAISYKQDRVGFIMAEINRLEGELLNFYSKRDRDPRRRMTIKGIKHR